MACLRLQIYVEPVLVNVCLMFAALDLTPFFVFGAQRKGRTGKASLGFILLDADNRFPLVFVVPPAIGVQYLPLWTSVIIWCLVVNKIGHVVSNVGNISGHFRNGHHHINAHFHPGFYFAPRMKSFIVKRGETGGVQYRFVRGAPHR